MAFLLSGHSDSLGIFGYHTTDTSDPSDTGWGGGGGNRTASPMSSAPTWFGWQGLERVPYASLVNFKQSTLCSTINEFAALLDFPVRNMLFCLW